VRVFTALLLVLGGLVLAGCGQQAEPAAIDSGVTGQVHLGPTCPVEIEGQPCDDEPAAGVEVRVSKQAPGEAYGAREPVATGTTDEHGKFRIDVAPGDYVVTATAGMSCEFMDAHVVAGGYTKVDVPCDTGIR